jgi:hypothetical protein
METAQFLTLAGLSVVSIGLCIYLLTKIRTITYLLEQPVVKKMSPQLKLKPVKVDELEDARAAAPARNNANGAPQNRGPRPGMEGDRGRDNGRDRAPRGDRPEGEGRREGGDRPDRMDRGPRNDRGDRGDRFGDRGRDRDRGGRHERHDRGDRFNDRIGGREGAPSREGGRDRNREGFGGEREPSAAPVTAEAAPSAPAAPALAPRRPLPSTVDQESPAPAAAPVDALAANAAAEDALFTRDDSDIQHGRRHQPKKKPRFDVNEEEVKEETKAL